MRSAVSLASFGSSLRSAAILSRPPALPQQQQHGQVDIELVRNRRGLASLAASVGGPRKNADGNFVCTMIPGDGVGPDMMDSVKNVLKSAGAPVDFDELHISEVERSTRSIDLGRV